MRVTALILFSIAVSGGAVAFAQSEPAARERGAGRQQEAPDEVVVRGRRIGELRSEIEMARQRAYDIFNEINSNNEFDVACRGESRSGTRVPRQVCRAQFENRVSADAAKEYFAALNWSCPPDLAGQECMFSNYSSGAISAAQGVETRALGKRDEMNEEILRLANENDEFAQAILDFYEASQRYDAARKQRERD